MPRAVTDANSFWARVRRGPPDVCWVWLGSKDKDGYGRVSVRNRGRRAHRFVWELAHGREPAGLVTHTCDNPPCVNPAHLVEGTPLSNMQDKVARGRMPDQSGEQAPGSKLTWPVVRSIRRRYAETDATQQTLADEHDVALMTVNDIIKERTWKK